MCAEITATTQLLKSPKTFEEQITILRQHGLKIEDENLAMDILSKLNYYRFSAYLLPFKNVSNKQYKSDTTFAKIYELYEFDRKLRGILMSITEPIEVLLKTKIAYFHAHKYGSNGYTKPENFISVERHARFMDEFRNATRNNSKALFVKHHIKNYDSQFPIWVATELFSLGMISKFYANMNTTDKKEFAKNNFFTGSDHLESWLACLTDLRNRCAHYMRLYFHKFINFPKFPKGFSGTRSERLFDIIYVLQYLYLDKHKWNNEFILPLEALLLEYNEAIDLNYIGFPENWLYLLQNGNRK